VRPREAGTAAVTDGRLAAQLPPVSWNVIRLRRAV
jgi:alpha-N-arabinofuranosidase